MTTFPSGVEEDRRRHMEAPLPDPGPSVSNLLQYELDFFRALATFRHQVVYDPITRTTVHLEPIDISSLPLCLQYLLPKQREKDSLTVSRALSFVGEILDPVIATGIADGTLHPATYQPFDLGEGVVGISETSADAALREFFLRWA